jgi:glycosyltransferase involved in cell wall biosynthesis
MPENVRWAGARLQGGVGAAMRDADLFVLLPSVEDAFGLVTLEAMASGLPVIVTDHVGASELIFHRKDGFMGVVRRTRARACGRSPLRRSPPKPASAVS